MQVDHGSGVQEYQLNVNGHLILVVCKVKKQCTSGKLVSMSQMRKVLEYCAKCGNIVGDNIHQMGKRLW